MILLKIFFVHKGVSLSKEIHALAERSAFANGKYAASDSKNLCGLCV
ncbi:MAG TPA: hypothetical protein VF455_13370 [Chryseobacterium sp.]